MARQHNSRLLSAARHATAAAPRAALLRAGAHPWAPPRRQQGATRRVQQRGSVLQRVSGPARYSAACVAATDCCASRSVFPPPPQARSRASRTQLEPGVPPDTLCVALCVRWTTHSTHVDVASCAAAAALHLRRAAAAATVAKAPRGGGGLSRLVLLLDAGAERAWTLRCGRM